MTKSRFTQIGLDRLVRLVLLERTSALVLAGNDAKSIKERLQEDLLGTFRSSNTDVRGSIDKTITIQLKIWLKSQEDLELLRTDGLELIRILPRQERIAVHWGMTMAVYPFWFSVATQVGRLLRLQGTVAAPQIQRRVREQYGDRETVTRRTRYIIRSFLDWGVLQETGTKGIYSAGATLALDDPQLVTWLLEASLHARANGSAPLKELIDSPNLFPFRIKPVHAESLVAASPRLDLLAHGLDDYHVMLSNYTARNLK